MYLRLLLPVLVLTLVTRLGANVPVDANRESAAAASLLAFGRLPDAAEYESAATMSKATLAERIEALRTRLKGDAALSAATAAKAWRDAFGTSAGADLAKADGKTYVELLQTHLRQLAAQRDEYRRVIERAYQKVLGRAPYDIEFDYWAEKDVAPYILLAGCIEHWAQRNLPGLMSTTGEPSISIHCRQLITLRIETPHANAARSAAGLPPAGNWAAAREHHVIAPGAQAIVAVGGIHFIAVGRD